MSVLLNGRLSPDNFSMSVQDRAFQYGDGIFETLVAQDGKILHMNYHWQRLLDGAKAIRLQIPEQLNEQYLQNQAQVLIEENALQGKCRLKLILWRQAGGLYTPKTNQANFLLKAEVFNVGRVVKERAAFAKTVQLSYHPWSKYKTLNSLPYILANLEREERKLDELVLLNQQGFICECSSSNVFWSINGVFYTPSLESGCIAGVQRHVILEVLKSKKSKVHEGLFLPEELQKADFIFCTNVTGIFPLLHLEGEAKQSPDLAWLQGLGN